MPRLSDLLNQPRLGLSLDSGSADSSFKAVQVLSEETLWLEPHSLCLMPKPFSHFDLFKAAQPAALIYHAQTAPAESLRLWCQEQELSLITLPHPQSFERVQEAAFKLLLAEADGLVSPTIYAYLLEALESDKPEKDMLERLEKLCAAHFALYNAWGGLLAQAGIMNLNERALKLAEGKHQTESENLWVFQIQLGGMAKAKLLALGLEDRFVPLLQTCVQLLAHSLQHKDLQLELKSTRKEALFEEWLLGKAQDLRFRLASYSFDYGIDYVVMVARPKKQRKAALEPYLIALKERGDGFFTGLDFPFLSARRESHCVWVISTSNTAMLAAFYEALWSAEEGPRLGSSLPSANYADLNKAYQQAMQALDAVDSQIGYASFSNLDPIYASLQGLPRDRLEALREAFIGRLQKADKSGKLRETLKAYLKNPEDLTGLAKRMNVHSNTLRYRLAKIEGLIGKPLSKPETLAQLYLAQQMDALLED